MRRRQEGLAAVEFAMVGVAAMTLLIVCIEIGRLLFVWNTLGEATRRGARVAAVTPIGSSSARDAVMTFSPFIRDLAGTHVKVAYLDTAGADLGGAPAPETVAFVNVSISGYVHEMLLPTGFLGAFDPEVHAPSFSTTLPAESLGSDPDA